LTSPATAQDSDWRDWPTGGKWSIGAGFFAPDLDTKIIVTDEDQIVGTGISFEQNLGLDDSKGTGLLFVNWRMAKKHALEYRFFQLNRSSAIESGSVAIGIGILQAGQNAIPIVIRVQVVRKTVAVGVRPRIGRRVTVEVGIGILEDNRGVAACEEAWASSRTTVALRSPSRSTT